MESKKFNFNTIVCFIILAVVSWVGATLISLKDEVIRLKVTNENRATQVDRIEAQVNRLKDQFSDMQLDIARMKGNAKP